MQVNRNKSSVKGYKTLLLRVKQLKSKSNTSKQNQIKQLETIISCALRQKTIFVGVGVCWVGMTFNMGLLIALRNSLKILETGERERGIQ